MRSFSGSSWSGSVLLNVHPRLSLGSRVEQRHRVRGGRDIHVHAAPSSIRSRRGDFKLPSSWEVGAAFGITERWWLSAHYWRRSAPEPRGFEQLAGSIGDERLMSFGVEKRCGRGREASSREFPCGSDSTRTAGISSIPPAVP